MLTNNVFGYDIKSYLGNEDATQCGEISREDFIAILTKMVNENKTLTDKMMKGLSQCSDNLEGVDKNELLGIIDEISIKLAEQINQNFEELKAAQYVIASMMAALSSMKNNGMLQNLVNVSEQNLNENNNEFLQTNYDSQDIKLLTEIDEKINYFQKMSSENISDIDFAAELSQDIQQLIAKPEKVALANKADLQAFIDSESDSAGSQKNMINAQKLTERQINQAILPIHNNDELTISEPEIQEPLNKYNNLSNSTKYYFASKKEADILIQTNTSSDYLKDQPGGDEFSFFGKKDTKYASNEIPLSESRQTFSESIIKNTVVESSIPKIKVINNESPNINGDKIYFSKTDDATVRLAIEPEGMGMLDIELTLEKGIVNAHILASESAGKNFLDNNLSNILNNLLREGLNVGKFSVSLGDRKNGTGDNNNGTRQRGTKVLEDLSLLKNNNKNNLISIFA